MKLSPIVDHGYLQGLGDDDHPQYLHLNKAGQTLLQNLSVVSGKTIDGVDISVLNGLQHFTNLLAPYGGMESWPGGGGANPDGWTCVRSTPLRSALSKQGNYCLRLTSNGNWAYAYHHISEVNYYKGRTVTLGCWVAAILGNDQEASIAINDGVSWTYSVPAMKDGIYRFLTVTKTIDLNATSVTAALFVNNTANSDTDDVAYFDGAILVEGTICPAYMPPSELYKAYDAKARAYQSSAQTIADATDTKVNLQTENYDPSGSFANSRFTAKEAGYYLCLGQVCLVNLVDGEFVAAIIRKNGVDTAWHHDWSPLTLESAYMSPDVSDIVDLAVNDYVELWVRHGMGGNRNLCTGSKNTFLAVHLLSKL